MNNNLFKAIADPTRRQIITLIIENNSPTLNEVSSNFKMSRQAVTKHINILENVGLVTVEKIGREKHCNVNPKPLKEVYDWIKNYKEFWEDKLSSLEKYLDES
jgi:DNA-binding transcriptional ArsR family regulator